MWVNHLYTCLDLEKYDDAIQTCAELLNLRARKSSSESVPLPEEKCVRAVVGGALRRDREARATGDGPASASSRRTLARVQELLDRLKSAVTSEVWIYEVSAYFHQAVGLREGALDDLMKEYRRLQSTDWARDPATTSRMNNVVHAIVGAYKAEGTGASALKGKLLVNGALKKLRAAAGEAEPPAEVREMEALLSELEKGTASATE